MIKNLQINTKKLKHGMKKMVLVAGLSGMILTLPGCSEDKDSTNTLYDTALEYEAINSFDNILNSYDLSEVADLEKYINYAKKMHKMNINREKDVSLENQTIKEDAYIEYFINHPEKNPEEFLIQEKLINKYIYDHYEMMEKICKVCLQAKIVDAYNLPYDSYDNIEIPPQTIEDVPLDAYMTFSINEKDYTVKIPLSSMMDKELNSLYQMENKGGEFSYKETPEENQYQYDETTIQAMENAITNTKNLLKRNANNNMNIIEKIKDIILGNRKATYIGFDDNHTSKKKSRN